MTNKQISLIKSAIRIEGYFLLLVGQLWPAALVLIISEFLGIIEKVE